MIGDLLKHLFRALGRYARYRAARLSGRFARGAPVIAPSAAGNENTTEQIGLDSAFERTIQWPLYQKKIPAPEVLSNSLYQLWSTSTSGGHKWTHYFAVYEKVFGEIRVRPLRILEIGVLDGASLRLWKQYFSHPDTMIVGIDIQGPCIKFDSPANGIRVRIGDQCDSQFLTSVVHEFGPFDLIIDDGSHFSSHIITSFNHLFLNALKDSGIYLVEDLHANYWHPWRDSKRSFLDVCKELIEHMHDHYRGGPAAFSPEQQAEFPRESVDVPLVTTMIKEIRFFDSIVAIYKARLEYVPYYVRT